MGMGSPAPAAGGLTPETLAALRQMGIDPNNAAATAPAPPVQPPAVPLPNVAPEPAPQEGFLSGLAKMLSGLFMGGTSAQELAGPQAPLTPEELQRRRQQFAQPQQ